jgi:Rrf2 family iron-sulfur cluster assembly transcriptional regulator
MRITTKGRYGLRAVVSLAGAQDGKPLAISKIAKEEGVSAEFLEQIFFRLKKSGMIRSHRGPHGGFVLGRPPDKITVNEILAAVDERIAPAPCADQEGDHDCERSPDCPAHAMWNELSDIIAGYLQHVTVQDLMDRKTSYFPSLLGEVRKAAKASSRP